MKYFNLLSEKKQETLRKARARVFRAYRLSRLEVF